ncbi:Peroxisome chaperone and import receptor [Malassezia caprae]|uniref:Peroxisome chaperone and import receptor n=1 Tax=Malassezia caprae TaxID=1381934 RepID=A0AAF0ITY7_9BASI|nr:Peroxisome chaperone and import receptor [Malassezia caprae]
MAPSQSVADDLDDLDGTYVLDDFEQPSAPSTQPEAASTGGAPPAPTAEARQSEEDPLSDEFVEELTKNMESFMAQIGQRMSTAQDVPPPPADSASGAGDAESGAAGGVPPAEDELMKQFEKMLSGNLSQWEAEAPAPAASAPAEGLSEKSFQDAVQATMAKLKQSNANAASKSSSDASNPLGSLGLGSDSDLAQILEALSKVSGEDGKMPDLGQMLTQMMEDLMNKEILYEPLKDLHQRFPSYLSSPAAQALEDSQRQRYVEQQAIMGEIVAVFEAPGYTDTDTAARKRVTDLVSKLQETGSPPQELVGDMPPELAGLNGLLGDQGDDQCTVM